jgi:hypothetical protein
VQAVMQGDQRNDNPLLRSKIRSPRRRTPKIALGTQQCLQRQPPGGSIGHRHHKRRQKEVYTSSDNGLTSSERDTDPTDSDQGGHDN